jgi:acyl-CoA dehydrogenase
MQQSSLYVARGYGIVREQFGLQIGKFHAVAGVIAKMAVDLYATDAARRYTAAALDHGESPSVASAILKVHLTEAGRRAVNDAMDILGGKGIMRGPSNLLAVAYRHAPIAITVEGANILTRALIIFGQGAVRCHPFVFEEMSAVEKSDTERLGRALIGHAGHVLRNLGHSLFGAPVIGHPPDELRKEARLIARLSAKYALTADLAMGLLGGKLKRMELLSARLGDVLSHLYLAATCLWRYDVEAEPVLLPIARAAVRVQLDEAARALRDLYANLPSPARRVLGAIILGGTGFLAPLRDRQLLAFAETLRTDSRVLARLCPDIMESKSGGMRDLMQALALAKELGDEVPELNKVVRRTASLETAARGSRNPERALAYLQAADRVIQVDDFEKTTVSASPCTKAQSPPPLAGEG